MDQRTGSLQIAILLYPGVSALDAVGPWEVLWRVPNTDVRFVGKEEGPVVAEGGALLLGVTHTIEQTISPDLVLVPGGNDHAGPDGRRRCARLASLGTPDDEMDRIGLHGGLDPGSRGNPEGLPRYDALVQDGRTSDYGREAPARPTHRALGQDRYGCRRVGRYRSGALVGR